MTLLLFMIATIVAMILELHSIVYPFDCLKDYKDYIRYLQLGVFVLYLFITYIVFWGSHV